MNHILKQVLFIAIEIACAQNIALKAKILHNTRNLFYPKINESMHTTKE